MRCNGCGCDVKSDYKYCPHCSKRLVQGYQDQFDTLEPAFVIDPEKAVDEPIAEFFDAPEPDVFPQEPACWSHENSAGTPLGDAASVPLEEPAAEEVPAQRAAAFPVERPKYYVYVPGGRQAQSKPPAQQQPAPVLEPDVPAKSLENDLPPEPLENDLPPEPLENVLAPESFGDDLPAVFEAALFAKPPDAEWPAKEEAESAEPLRAFSPEEVAEFERLSELEAEEADVAEAQTAFGLEQIPRLEEDESYIELEKTPSKRAETTNAPRADHLGTRLLVCLLMLLMGGLLSYVLYQWMNTAGVMERFGFEALFAYVPGGVNGL